LQLINTEEIYAMHDREEFLEELKLREYIRKAIRIVEQKKLKAKGQEMLEEQQLRSFVRSLLKEELLNEKEAVADTPPHSSTGINVLEDLLKKIVPVLETDFKVLTSDPEQRRSFRAHIINAVKNALAPARASAEDEAAAELAGEPLAEADISVDVDDEEGDDAAFIDIGGYGPEETEEEEDTFTIAGEDETGRNVAEKSFDKIEQNILDSYEVLAQEEDKNTFYDYLLTNLKLYFDKFEDEVPGSELEEPTTPEYEQEKAQQDTMDVDGASAAGDLGAAEGELEL
jgi:hypothetical protein